MQCVTIVTNITLLGVTLTTSLFKSGTITIDTLVRSERPQIFPGIALRRAGGRLRELGNVLHYVHPPSPGICRSGLALRPRHSSVQPTENNLNAQRLCLRSKFPVLNYCQ